MATRADHAADFFGGSTLTKVVSDSGDGPLGGEPATARTDRVIAHPPGYYATAVT
jgi:hypothetical protein